MIITGDLVSSAISNHSTHAYACWWKTTQL